MGEEACITTEMVERATEAFHRSECRCTLFDEAPGHRAWYRRVAEMSLVAAREVDPLVAEVERLRKALHQTEHVVVLDANGWSVEHLVECRRIPNGMTKCAVHEAMNVFSDELLDDHGYGRFRLVGWDDDYPMLALVAESEGAAVDDALSAPPTDRGAMTGNEGTP